MLESATVTLSYKEFQALKEKADEAQNLDKKILKLEKIIEDKVERKSLDKICNTLVEATHLGKTKEQKQKFINECVEIYCNTFNIPRSAIME